MAKKSACEKYGYLDRLSTEQLEELLRADFESDEDSNVDVIFHILEVIEKRERGNPTGQLPDTKMAWEEFQQYYNIPEGDSVQLYPSNQTATAETKPAVVVGLAPAISHPSRMRRILWNILVASIAVTVFFSGMVVAQAAGFDIFGAIGQWTEETFHFISTGETTGKAAANRNTEKAAHPESSQYCAAIQDTLANYGMDESLAPSWFPSDVKMLDPEILSNDYSDIIYFLFRSDDGKFFSIDISQYRTVEDLNAALFEKDSRPVEPYTSNERTYYLFSNEDAITATWSSGLLTETITGNLQIDELKAILDSIGENKK